MSVAVASNPTGRGAGRRAFRDPSQVGVAAFSGLKLTKAASGYTLQVSSSGLTSATS